MFSTPPIRLVVPIKACIPTSSMLTGVRTAVIWSTRRHQASAFGLKFNINVSKDVKPTGEANCGHLSGWNQLRTVCDSPKGLDQSKGDNQGSQKNKKETDSPGVPKKIDKSKVPTLNEDDLEEVFISGWGPGGQNVNKSINCCQLRHKPSGLLVKVHNSRSLEQNRKLARELLTQKLDNLYNGEHSVESQKKRLALHRISIRESQAEKRRAMKEQFKKLVDR